MACSASTPGFGGRREAVRRFRRLAGIGLLALGLLLLSEAAVTVLWQEPFTALSTRAQQKKLATELDRLESRRLGAAGRPAAAGLPALAGALERRSRPGDPLGRIVISRIGARFVFVSGTGAGELRKGPGHYAGTVLPGERGTVAIAGHRTTYLAPFKRIDRLRRGDRIELRMPYGAFTYVVAGAKVVAPHDVGVLRGGAGDRLVLTACHPLFSTAERIVVSARLAKASPSGASRARTSRARAPAAARA